MHSIEEIEGYAFYLWVCDDVCALCNGTVYYNILAAGGTRRRDFMADFVCVLSVQRGQCFFSGTGGGQEGNADTSYPALCSDKCDCAGVRFFV